MTHTISRGLGALALALALTAPVGLAAAQAGWPIEQVSANTQPGWGKVYATTSAGGWYAALFSNGDLDPDGPGNRDRSWEVFRWAADGSYTQITDSRAERPPPVRTGTSAPVLSADGRRIAFTSVQDLVPGGPGNADGSREIFLWTEGDGLQQITDTAGPVETDDVGSHHPWISGDGTKIVFASDMHGRQPGAGLYAATQTDIYLWTDDDGVRRLTEVASPSRRAWMPRLSRDGRYVVFFSNADLDPDGIRNTDGSSELFRWSADAGFEQLTDHASGIGTMGLWAAPAVSADGTTVAFESDSDLVPSAPGNADGSTEVFLWREGAGVDQVTDTPDHKAARSPALSADGRTLAFLSTHDLTPGAPGNADGGMELYLRRPGGTLEQLTQGDPVGGILLPVLSDRAELVAFLSDRDLAVGNHVLTPQTFVIRLSPLVPPDEGDGTADLEPRGCPQLDGRVPAAVRAAALADPAKIAGWGELRNPGLPAGPGNPRRTWLSLRDIGKPFSPANRLVFKVGCP